MEHDDCPAWCVIPHALMPWARVHASAPVEVGTLGRACLMQDPAGGGHPYILTVPGELSPAPVKSRPVRWSREQAADLAAALEHAGAPAPAVEVRRLLALSEHVQITAMVGTADPETPDFVPECCECGVWPCETADRLRLLDLYAPADALSMVAVGPTADEVPF